MLDSKAIRGQLRRRLGDLMGRQDKIEAHFIRPDDPLPNDPEEQLPEAEMGDVYERLDDATRAEIMAVRAAIRRIDEGIWTICENCGENIPEARLAALPTATRCLSCAEEQG